MGRLEVFNIDNKKSKYYDYCKPSMVPGRPVIHMLN